MSVRVVLHAEGGKETGALALRPKPGSTLADDDLGAAHIIVRRSIVAATGIAEAAVRMIEPLRLTTGLVARGSRLLDRGALRKLLAWPDRTTRPDLGVVIVDADGHPERLREIVEWTSDAMLVPIVGVAIQEFESWLVADESSVANAIGEEFPTAPAPESMRPKEAKELFERAVTRSGADPALARCTVAQVADLDAIARRCPSFKAFAAELPREASAVVARSRP